MPSLAISCPGKAEDGDANSSTGDVGSLEHLRSSEAFPKVTPPHCLL